MKIQERPLTNELEISGMLVRTVQTSPNIDNQTFYVSSQTNPEKTYVVRTRRVMVKFSNQFGIEVDPPTCFRPNLNDYEYICSCPDFIFREWAGRKDCKHIEAVKTLAKLAGNPYLLAQKLREL